jgi:hypothetical protein
MLAPLFAALLVLGLVSTLSPSDVHAATGTFGYTPLGSTTIAAGSSNAGLMCGYHATPSYNGTVDSISAYVYAQSGTVDLIGALYTYVGPGAPGTLIANTSEITVGPTPEWNNMTFSSPPNVTAGTQYWIVWWQDGGTYYRYDMGQTYGVGFYILSLSGFPNLPSSLVGYNVVPSYAKRSLFATYTVSTRELIALNTPRNGVTLSSLTVKFNFTTTSYGLGEFYSAELWTNETGTWAYTASNTTAVQNATLTTIPYSFSSAGTFEWNVRVTNSTSAFWAPSNYTLTLVVGKNVIFSDGFESGTLLTSQTPPGAWDGDELPDGIPGGSSSVQSKVVYAGRYAANFTAEGYRQYGCVYKSLNAPYTSLYSSAEVRFTRMPLYAVFGPTLCYNYDAGAFFYMLQNMSGHEYWGIQVYLDDGTFTNFLESVPSDPSPNTWYNVTLFGQTGAGKGNATLWVNGVLKASVTGLNITVRAPLTCVRDEFWLDMDEPSPISCYTDNVLVYNYTDFVGTPHLLLTADPDQATYAGGQSVTFTVDVLNQLCPALASTLTLTVTGPNACYYYDFQSINVTANSVAEYSFTWIIPNAAAGTYVVEVSLIPAQLTAYDAVWLQVVPS